jgi:hypothetical protein
MPDPDPRDPAEHRARIRAQVSRALDEDAFVLALDGALEAVAEHARLRAVDENAFVAMARAAYQAVAGKPPAQQEGIDLPT